MIPSSLYPQMTGVCSVRTYGLVRARAAYILQTAYILCMRRVTLLYLLFISFSVFPPTCSLYFNYDFDEICSCTSCAAGPISLVICTLHPYGEIFFECNRVSRYVSLFRIIG